MGKFGKICRHHLKERLKISKITKYKSDLLQGNKDTDSQSRHILQTFMCCPPPYKRWTTKQSVFLRIQVHASSQTKGLERGWKQRARLGRDAKNISSLAGRVRLARFARVRLLRNALPISLLIFRKKPTVLQSIQTSVHFGNFAELYRRSRKTYHFKTWRFC